MLYYLIVSIIPIQFWSQSNNMAGRWYGSYNPIVYSILMDIVPLSYKGKQMPI